MNDCNNLSRNQIPGNIWTKIRSSHLDFAPQNKKKHSMQPPSCGGEFVMMMMMMQGDDLAQVHQQEEEEEDPNTILEIPYPFSTLS